MARAKRRSVPKKDIKELKDTWEQIKAIIVKRPLTGRQGGQLVGKFEELLKQNK